MVRLGQFRDAAAVTGAALQRLNFFKSCVSSSVCGRQYPVFIYLCLLTVPTDGIPFMKLDTVNKKVPGELGPVNRLLDQMEMRTKDNGGFFLNFVFCFEEKMQRTLWLVACCYDPTQRDRYPPAQLLCVASGQTTKVPHVSLNFCCRSTLIICAIM